MVEDTHVREHEERLAWLKELATGGVSPGTEPMPASSSQVNPEFVAFDETCVLTRSGMEGFT
jgi:hypothetical protein